MRRKILSPLLFIVVLAVTGLTATLATGSGPELGLDLQGGVSVVLAPTTEATDEQLSETVNIIRRRVDALGVAEPEITRQGDAVVVQLPGVRNRDRALELVGQTAELRFRPVLSYLGEGGDGGDGADGAEGSGADGDATTTTEAPDGDATTTTEAPDEDATTTTEAPDDEGALGLAPGESAAGLAPGESAAAPRQETTTTTAPLDEDGGAAQDDAGGDDAPVDESAPSELTSREDDEADATVVLADEEGQRYQLGPTLATGRIVQDAQAEFREQQWAVALTMRGGEDGIDTFNEIASECFNRTQVCPTGALSIVLDSVVQSAPSINNASYSRDQIQITGEFDESEAKDLALVLRYGSLPLELERQTVQTVSASLGEDSLRAGLFAGFAGLGLVALYMVFYYRALGVVVILGLGVWGSLLYTIVSWLGETQGLALTLAGVTGIIVSIGVTVDSYVVFFERLKEEVRAGRTLRSSTERAFKRAFRTILTADVSSFLGAAVLWWLTIGSVRGFAFFLGLSTVLDVVVAWFFTRPMVTSLSRSRLFTAMPVLGVARGVASPTDAGTPRPATAGASR